MTQAIAAIAIFASLAVSAYLIYRAQEAQEPDVEANAATTPPARWTPPAKPEPGPAAATAAAPAETIAPAEGTTGAAPAAADAVPRDGASFSLQLEAHDYCWVRLTRGEDEEMDFILKPGERFQRDFSGEINLKLGNAGGVNLFLNGRAALPLGQRGEVIDLTLSPSSLSRFLPKTQEP